jgi:hypothetical protein
VDGQCKLPVDVVPSCRESTCRSTETFDLVECLDSTRMSIAATGDGQEDPRRWSIESCNERLGVELESLAFRWRVSSLSRNVSSGWSNLTYGLLRIDRCFLAPFCLPLGCCQLSSGHRMIDACRTWPILLFPDQSLVR